MAAAAHDPEFAAKMGIPQDVAREYNEADQAQAAKKPSGGGHHRLVAAMMRRYGG